ncbi:MAG: hypothetical protein NTZ48_01665 [Candidatus Omnitrophica bacterium]|nr:hypothetical protein [Candidatus Omnitrophota bacterium]
MIVPMSKVNVIMQAKDAESVLERLRLFGVLHVEHGQIPSGKDMGVVKEDIELIDEAARILSISEPLKDKEYKTVENFKEWYPLARHVIDLWKRLEQLREYSITLTKNISDWESWGDFDPEEIEKLAEKHIYLNLYQIPARSLKALPSDIIIEKISGHGGMVNCAVISNRKIEIPFKEFLLPKMGLFKMKARLRENGCMISSLEKDLCEHVTFRNGLLVIKKQLEMSLEFKEALGGMNTYEDITCLKGFIPRDKENLLLDTAKKEKWGIITEEPSEEDMVPTLVRNPRWVGIISPVFKLIEIIPGYRELDISPLFLAFLSLFFGMIIGDAGYGAIYFIATLFAHKKLSKKVKDTKVFFLFYVFSACAIFWGLLTGTVFGQEWYIKAGLKPFIPILNNTKFLQAFCFFVGAFHLSLGHGWQAVRKMPSLTALADIGWISVLWAAFFLARMLILDEPLPFFGKWLIIGGLFLVLLFTSPQRNILKMLGQGLANIALNLMNNFTDVVSYVRLFAVGLAGVAIADTVNSLAGDMGSNPALKILIIFLGHTINIILGPMSVLVHGIRLNVLEFSSHAGLSWSGVAYKPLKLKSDTKIICHEKLADSIFDRQLMVS